jgi:DNA-binding CsgD family transcriptional regulator
MHGNRTDDDRLCTAEDVTRVRRQFDEADERWRVGIGLSSTPTVLADREGRFLATNAALAAVTGTPMIEPGRGTASRGRWADVCHPDDLPALERHLEALFRGERLESHFAVRLVDPTGAPVPTEVSAACPRDADGGRSTCLVCLRRHTTEGSLGAFVALLADSPDGEVVARAVAGGLLAAFGPTAVTVHVADPGRRELGLAAQVGLEPEQSRLYARVPIDARLPLAEVYRSGEDLALTLDDVAERYPLAARWVQANPDRDRGELLAVPIRSRAVPIGVLTVQFPTPPPRTWPLRSALDDTAHALAVWVLARPDRTGRAGSTETRSGDLRITERQREILSLVRSGCTNREIAGRIRFSEATVRAELASLSRLLGARGRHDVVAKAADAGI